MEKGRTGRATLVVTAIALAGLTACEPVDCIVTTAQATDASVVDASDVEQSAVLAATVTAEDGPVEGVDVAFFMKSRQIGRATTDGKGRAVLDLKGQPLTLVRTIRSNSYDAVFSGNGRYCSSSDEAGMRLVQT